MDVKRLEELAAQAMRCANDCDDEEVVRTAFADLARCAAAWAKVERNKRPCLERRDWPQGTRWYFWGTGLSAVSGDTAIEAVEAAKEVTNAK